ncbi:SDR family NAD(P)-dependent oxidoreductase [Luteolibacter sp. LG18]|uniref:SDR family oxidoreductase n=1 Tax=Luteolibacter sp. LG18 TaxID=2819286 RepID=UPI002B2E24E7|nr:oxidoreductase [Luteolibacter sp. LG18]
MSPLQGQTILVTGASSGIGRALCEQLVYRGANVLGVTRRPSALPEDVSPIVADLSQRDEVSTVFRGLGRIDALVNSAGIAHLAPIINGNPADWEEMWRVNVLALTLCCQLSLRHFPADGGRIVNVSSMSGHRVPPTGGFYSPTKFAVRAVTDSLRHELKAAGSKIQVSSVSPGFVDTPLLETYFLGREETLKGIRAHMKMLTPVDVAYCILTILEAPAHVEIGDIQLRSSDQPQ